MTLSLSLLHGLDLVTCCGFLPLLVIILLLVSPAVGELEALDHAWFHSPDMPTPSGLAAIKFSCEVCSRMLQLLMNPTAGDLHDLCLAVYAQDMWILECLERGLSKASSLLSCLS